MNASADAPVTGGEPGGVSISASRHMARALELAERGRGRVEPNPVVGAVVVNEGLVVGEGWHARYGGPHAEVVALEAAGSAARGATLYVTLEPCNHFGKTPPCVDALVRAGVARVVAAIPDPNDVAAGGAARLREAGIAVEIGDGADEALGQNAPFLKRVRQGLPFVTLKWAMTLDGKIATRAGDARWITSEEARRAAHGMRDRADAVLVGIGTALADDPELTTRIQGGRDAIRVVLDARARLPLDAKLIRGARESSAPLLIATTAAAPAERIDALRAAGAEILVVGEASVDVVALARALASRADRPVTNLLVEGGARVHAAFLEAGLADRVAVFIAPKIVGGAAAPSPVAGAGAERLADALRLAAAPRLTPLGQDLLLEGEIARQGDIPRSGSSSFVQRPEEGLSEARARSCLTTSTR